MSGTLTLAAPSTSGSLTKGSPSSSATLTTAFTTSPTGRVFNERFSDRFKKSP